MSAGTTPEARADPALVHLERPSTRVRDLRRRRPGAGAAPRAADGRPPQPGRGAGAGGAGAPGRAAGPAGPRRERQAAARRRVPGRRVHRAGRGAARPSGGRAGRGRRAVAGRQRGARSVAARHPERVQGLVLEMPVLERAVPAAALTFVPALLAVHYAIPVARAVSWLARRLSRVSGEVVAGLLAPLASPPEVTTAVLHGILVGPTVPTVEERRSVRAPALVLGHRADLIHPFSDAEALVRQMPDGPAGGGGQHRRAAAASRPAAGRDRAVPGGGVGRLDRSRGPGGPVAMATASPPGPGPVRRPRCGCRLRPAGAAPAGPPHGRGDGESDRRGALARLHHPRPPPAAVPHVVAVLGHAHVPG